MEGKVDMKYQLLRLHLNQYFIQQKDDQNYQHLCHQLCVYTSAYIY